ncbi:MAG: hypothetical protein J0H15_04660 [Xanthomonadales bacterium]|nr:hypothetical protein [Xanthomonadales bacterium]
MIANIYMFEGAWEKATEPPQMLKFMQAYEQTFPGTRVHHRSFRNGEDLAYYLAKIPARQRALVYIACHGEVGLLEPSDKKSRITMATLLDILKSAFPQRIGFLHFGCCHILQPDDGLRRKLLVSLQEASGATFVSGYTKEVDWLESTLLDLALIHSVYVEWRDKPTHVSKPMKSLEDFTSDYRPLIKKLGFSAMSSFGNKSQVLWPRKICGQ